MLSKCLGRILLIRTGALTRSIRYSSIASGNPQEGVEPIQTKVQGWVRAVRRTKTCVFLDVFDGTSSNVMQVVIPRDDVPKDLSFGCSVVAEGVLAKARSGSPEIQARTVSVLGQCKAEDNYPFTQNKEYSMEYLRDYLHLRPRDKTIASLLRLRSIATLAINDHFRQRGFINIHTPIITANDCEGAGELFKVKPSDADLREMAQGNISLDGAYFDTEAYLSVSAQLHLEAMARALTKVYTFAPAFRAENSKSRHHLSEFYMLEAEVAFINSLSDVMDEVELLVKNVTEMVIQEGANDFCQINGVEPKWLKNDFIRMTYDTAAEILDKHINRLRFGLKYGAPLSREHELFLVRHSGDVPVFVTSWPKEQKAFYMQECPNNPLQVDAIDLLAPNVGELVGGGMRETDYTKLKEKLPSDSLSWYLELRKFGNVQTGGFGLGFERFLQCILNVNNIKDAIPFPRWAHHCQM